MRPVSERARFAVPTSVLHLFLPFSRSGSGGGGGATRRGRQTTAMIPRRLRRVSSRAMDIFMSVLGQGVILLDCSVFCLLFYLQTERAFSWMAFIRGTFSTSLKGRLHTPLLDVAGQHRRAPSVRQGRHEVQNFHFAHCLSGKRGNTSNAFTGGRTGLGLGRVIGKYKQQ